MDAASALHSAHQAAIRQAGMLERPVTPAGPMAGAIRVLATSVAEPPESGDPGVPIATASLAAVLWTRFHKFDAADPRWPDRDRFVLSAGHGHLLLHALIHLTGHDGMSIDDIRDSGTLRSPVTGHPEYGVHPAIECTTGLSGQGLATAVGMAIAERNMAARFGKSLVDHRTWVLASDGDVIEGVGHEAAALAGQLALSKLTVLYDPDPVPADTDTAMPGLDGVLKCFSALGWATRQVDGHDAAAIAAALSFAVRSKKPTLVACRPVSGPGAAGAKADMDWHEPPFVIPPEVRDRWRAAGSRGASARRAWLKRLTRHAQRSEFERVMAGRLPDTWHDVLAGLKQDIADNRPKRGSHVSSQTCLEAMVPVAPELIVGSAGLTGSNPLPGRGIAPVSAAAYGGRCILSGHREHGMAAAANGMALHGGIIPCIGTFFALSDYSRPALRLTAILRQRVIYVLTHDPAGLGEAESAYRTVEQLAGLRAIPNLHVFRPADAMETAECWDLAMRRTDGPSVLALSSQDMPVWRTDTADNRTARGGYVLAEADGPRQATIIATGAQVPIAMAAREKLAGDAIAVAVVSLPCWELFALQDEDYRAQVLGGAPRVGIEAASGFGWAQWLGPDDTFIGMTGFGGLGPCEGPHAFFEITAEAAVAAVTRRLG